MWDHLDPRDLRSGWLNVQDLQCLAAIRRLEREIAEDHAAGFGVDSDRALDRLAGLYEQLRRS